MSINLLDMLKDQVTGSLAKQASSFLGESEENVTSGLGNIFPALLGSVINKSSEPSGAGGLMDLIGGLDMDMLGDIGGLFGGGSSSVNGLLNSGGGIVESLLGDKAGGIIEMISKVSGLKGGSTSSLLKMAAPFLMGIIGKQMKGKGLSFLTDLLMGQKEHVQAALPPSMSGLFGLGKMANNISGAVAGAAGGAMSGATKAAGNVANTAGNAARKTTAAANDAASKGMSWLKWALPLLLIGAVAIWGIKAGWLGGSAKDALTEVSEGVENVADAAGDATKAAGEMATDAAGAAGDVTNNAMDAVSDMAKSAFATVDEAAKAALDKVTFTANSAGSQMMNYINGGFKGDGKVTFQNLKFDVGSAKISGESGIEVDNLASILKAYPSVRIDISGYTDNTGNADSNKALSSARAMAVKGRLMGQGIDGNRIAAQGFGSENPVASNDTEEGRAQNRRIEVTIAK
jgi:outer membrane protein OmpA-like peptidoglycan-associated protein